MSIAPTRNDIRRLIDEKLLTSDELNAFLVDFFPDVARQLAADMSRTARVSRLLESEPNPVKIIAALESYAHRGSYQPPHAAQAHSAHRWLWLIPVGAAVSVATLFTIWRASPSSPTLAVTPQPAIAGSPQPVAPSPTPPVVRDMSAGTASDPVIGSHNIVDATKGSKVRISPEDNRAKGETGPADEKGVRGSFNRVKADDKSEVSISH